MRTIKPLVAVLTAGGLLLACGCIKIHLTVQLNEDGTGRVVEEIVFGEKLVNISRRLTDGPTVESLCADEYLDRRLASMGKGVTRVDKKVEKLPDGGIRLLVNYAYDDINSLRISPIPFNFGWENACLAFRLRDTTNIGNDYMLTMTRVAPRQEQPAAQPELTELESQDIRRLLPIFRDMLEGFELTIRLEVFAFEKWATVTKGHGATGGGTSLGNHLPMGGGRLTIFKLTDQNLYSSDDAMLMIVPWRQVGNEFVFYHFGHPPGPQLMPYTNFVRENGGFMFGWKAFQTPHGREYY